MRRRSLLVAVAVFAALLVPGTAGADPGAGGFMSPNVEWVGTIPLDSPGVGGKALTVDGQRRFYVTGLKGLSIYDVDDPALPVLLGTLPLPHAQNEDVEVSDDGSRVVISADGALLLPLFPATRGITVIDTSDPTAPRRTAFAAFSNHTGTCADAACDWLYGSGGRIYDLRRDGQVIDTGKSWFRNGVRGSHALNRDASGLLISDSTPRLVLDPMPDPRFPRVLASGRHNGTDGLLQHNNVRVGAQDWQPRAAGDDDPALRPGELFIGNSESNLRTRCNATAGGLSTWSMRNFDQGAPLQQLDVFRPVNGDYNTAGDPAANALGCSGHWFTVNGDIVAASWYEHGTKFFQVDLQTGDIEQVGFFNGVATEAGAAHWIDDEYVYSVDYARGIDILRFDRGAPLPTPEALAQSWALSAGRVGTLAEAERYWCRLGQDA